MKPTNQHLTNLLWCAIAGLLAMVVFAVIGVHIKIALAITAVFVAAAFAANELLDLSFALATRFGLAKSTGSTIVVLAILTLVCAAIGVAITTFGFSTIVKPVFDAIFG